MKFQIAIRRIPYHQAIASGKDYMAICRPFWMDNHLSWYGDTRDDALNGILVLIQRHLDGFGSSQNFEDDPELELVEVELNPCRASEVTEEEANEFYSISPDSDELAEAEAAEEQSQILLDKDDRYQFGRRPGDPLYGS